MTIKLIIDGNNTICWRHNNRTHNKYSYAIKYATGTKVWYKYDKYHRTDGPAIEYPNGSKAWYVNGKIHRLDGPAVEEISGETEYWINFIKYNSYLEYIVALEQYNANI